MSEFKEWESFYVIVGSSAGALIGLQFVVITLIAERPALRSAEGGAAFSTPQCGAFRSRAVVISHFECAVEWPRHCRSCLGVGRSLWNHLHLRRDAPDESTNHLPSCVRGLVISRSVAVRGVFDSGWLGMAGSWPFAWSVIPRRGGYAAAPFCWHSQRLGRGDLSRICPARAAGRA
jgi:hypothetical protein